MFFIEAEDCILSTTMIFTLLASVDKSIYLQSPATGCSAQSLSPATEGKLLSLNVFKKGEKARIYFINAPPSSHALREVIHKVHMYGYAHTTCTRTHARTHACMHARTHESAHFWNGIHAVY